MKLARWLSRLANRLAYSYWFLPAVMATSAFLLSIATDQLDQRVDLRNAPGWLVWGHRGGADGARAILSAVAGSMITVAGVTFSITIAALAQTASSYGPRILRNFLGDRGNQLTLGAYVATFIFCLMVLRTVRAPDDRGEQLFVPHFGITTSIILTLINVAIFIYFVHHIALSVHISHVISTIGRDLIGKICQAEERDGGAKKREVSPPRAGADELRAEQGGYVQEIDEERLTAIAEQINARVDFLYREGQFVAPGAVYALVSPAGCAERDLDRCANAIAWGDERSQHRDWTFYVDECVEIAARALSPGVNDPFTAIESVNWLAAALVEASRRVLEDGYSADRLGQIRVSAPAPTHLDFVDEVYDGLRPYVVSDRHAALHLVNASAKLVLDLESEPMRRRVIEHLEVMRSVLDQLDEPDRREVDDRIERVFELADAEDRARFIQRHFHTRGLAS